MDTISKQIYFLNTARDAGCALWEALKVFDAEDRQRVLQLVMSHVAELNIQAQANKK